jgi:hypothetical protein
LIDIESIEANSKLINLFQGFIAIDYNLYISNNNDRVQEIFGLGFPVVVTLAYSGLEGLV